MQIVPNKSTMDDQQFCLRWNNHQPTLVSVFDNLLQNETLVDCTLFAEGKFLKAHKLVLSACSPYFESLLTQQYDKHPVFILKDVKFQELKAIMDYMYRGEVNISLNQLAAVLKAAESLQIKGLSYSRSSKNDNEPPRKTAPPAKTPPPAPTIPPGHSLTIEQRKAPKLSASDTDIIEDSRSREGSTSPLPRKSAPRAKTPAPTIPPGHSLTIEQRKKPKLSACDTDIIEDSRSREGSTSPVPRKRKKPTLCTSQEGLNDNRDASNSSESHSKQTPTPNIPSSSTPLPTGPLAFTAKIIADVPEPPIETNAEILARISKHLQQYEQRQQQRSSLTSSVLPQVIKEKLDTYSELIMESKPEYLEDDSVHDLTLDDDDVLPMQQEMDHARPAPSHRSGDGSTQGFGGCFKSLRESSGNQNQEADVSELIRNYTAKRVSMMGKSTDKDSYLCSYCGMKFSQELNLDLHKNLAHLN